MQRIHGGKVAKGVIDYSSPKNPLGPPAIASRVLKEIVDSGIYVNYPDYEYKELRNVLAEHYKLDPDLIIPLNGSSESLQLLIPVIKPEALLVVEPTFGDHRIQAEVSNIRLSSIPYTLKNNRYVLDPENYYSAAEKIKSRFIALISNPNNPTGSVVSKRIIKELAEHSRESIVLVDEAFADFNGNAESLLYEDYDNVIVSRSLTKIFALQGLRIGFLYTSNKKLAFKLDSFRQAWNVNTFAERLIISILKWEGIEEYLENTRRLVDSERVFLSEQLKRIGLEVYDSKTPFLLVKHKIPHPEFNEKLLKLGFYVRNASSFGFLTHYHSRISIRLRDDNLKLIEALRDILGNN